MQGIRGEIIQEHCYDCVPKLVATSHSNNVPMLWNQQVKSDRTSPNNTPDN